MFDSLFPKEWTTLQRLMWLKTNALARAVYETVTGNPVTFTAKKSPLRQLSVAFSPVQSLNGYDAPWPAGGGKNKCDGTAYSAYLNSSIPYITPFTPIESPYSIVGNYNGVGFIVPVKAGVTYALSSDATGESQNWYCGVYSSVEDMTNRANCLEYASRQSNYTPTYDGFLLFMRYSMVAGTTVTWSYAQAEIGSTPTAFTPFSNICPISGWSSLTVYHSGADTSNPRSISISLGSTVYSGYVDVISGVGEIDYKLINARDVLWSSSGSVVYTHPNDLYTKITEETPTGRKPLYCNAIKYSANASLAGGGIGYGGINNNGNITVLMTSPWETPEEWIAYITNNDVFICYPLATPIPIQLTPQEVQSLLGDNVLFSDANGDLTVEYRSN